MNHRSYMTRVPPKTKPRGRPPGDKLVTKSYIFRGALSAKPGDPQWKLDPNYRSHEDLP